MQPNQPKPRPSLDGVRQSPSGRQPDYRPDHELPAPEPTPLLEKSPEMPADISSSMTSPDDATPNLSVKKPRNLKKWLFIGLASLLLLVVALGIGAFAWYQQQLSPVSADTSKHVRVTIASGMTPSAIADRLESQGVVRSSFAFGLYAKLSGAENNLKAGTYNLQPSLSTPKIVEHLVSGKEDTFSLTFLPGDTLDNNRTKLLKIGFTETEVDTALNKAYDRPLFATKPTGTDLEGYMYGETIEFNSSSLGSVETVLGRFFDEYEAVITENNLVEGFKKQGLTLYEASPWPL